MQNPVECVSGTSMNPQQWPMCQQKKMSGSPVLADLSGVSLPGCVYLLAQQHSPLNPTPLCLRCGLPDRCALFPTERRELMKQQMQRILAGNQGWMGSPKPDGRWVGEGIDPPPPTGHPGFLPTFWQNFSRCRSRFSFHAAVVGAGGGVDPPPPPAGWGRPGLPVQP